VGGSGSVASVDIGFSETEGGKDVAGKEPGVFVSEIAAAVVVNDSVLDIVVDVQLAANIRTTSK